MRVTNALARRASRKKWIKLARGYWGHKHISYKMAKQSVIRSWKFAFNDRKNLKSEFRKLWIARINAAVRKHSMNYSTFMHALKMHNVLLNRKMLSEIAIRDPKSFEEIIKIAKKPFPKKSLEKVKKVKKPFRPKMIAESKIKATSRRAKILKIRAQRIQAKSIKNNLAKKAKST